MCRGPASAVALEADSGATLKGFSIYPRRLIIVGL